MNVTLSLTLDLDPSDVLRLAPKVHGRVSSEVIEELLRIGHVSAAWLRRMETPAESIERRQDDFFDEEFS